MDDYSTILSSIGVVLPEAVRAYIGKVALDLAVLSGSPAPVLFVSKEEADAAILALAEKLRECEMERKAMEVCGTCGRYGEFGSAQYCKVECPDRINAYDHERHYLSPCKYEPSKWEPMLYDAEEASDGID